MRHLLTIAFGFLVLHSPVGKTILLNADHLLYAEENNNFCLGDVYLKLRDGTELCVKESPAKIKSLLK